MKKHIGWREWIALPDLGIDRVKAKVDTGARTSALHAFELETTLTDGTEWAEFSVHPRQRRSEPVIRCQAPILEFRPVRDSGGHIEERPVIVSILTLGGEQWPIEITLTGRDNMGFRMLLGRTAIRQRFIVDPGRSYLVGKK